jgi:hypothetical protein
MKIKTIFAPFGPPFALPAFVVAATTFSGRAALHFLRRSCRDSSWIVPPSSRECVSKTGSDALTFQSNINN